MNNLGRLLSKNIPFTNTTIFQLLIAVIVLIVAFIVVKIVVAFFKRGLKKAKLSELLVEFLGRFLSVLLYVAVILLVVRALGIAVGSIVLGLSAIVGLILGFGMQDTLTNLAAGVWLSALKPMDKDEVVTVSGMRGKVTAIRIMATELLTPDNTSISIPNKLVWGSPIVNYTRMSTRRVEVAVGISYESNLKKAIQAAMDLMKKHPLVLKDPAPAVVTTELADSSVNLQLRAWVDTENYWTVKFELTNTILGAFTKEEGIEIPYPQLDVHLQQKQDSR